MLKWFCCFLLYWTPLVLAINVNTTLFCIVAVYYFIGAWFYPIEDMSFESRIETMKNSITWPSRIRR